MHEPTVATHLAPERLYPGEPLRQAGTGGHSPAVWSFRRKLVTLALLIACSWLGLAGLLWVALQIAELEGRSGLLRYLTTF